VKGLVHAALLVAHIAVGTAAFLAVAAIAVGVDVLIARYLPVYTDDPVITWGLKLSKYAVFIGDLLLYFKFLYEQGRAHWRQTES
jgi:hypothetical protein